MENRAEQGACSRTRKKPRAAEAQRYARPKNWRSKMSDKKYPYVNHMNILYDALLISKIVQQSH
jgi:hypothetical protein